MPGKGELNPKRKQRQYFHNISCEERFILHVHHISGGVVISAHFTLTGKKESASSNSEALTFSLPEGMHFHDVRGTAILVLKGRRIPRQLKRND